MRISKETWFQIGIALATIIASAFVPEIRSFFDSLLKNIPALLIVAGIVAIFYLQTKKMVKKNQKLFEEKQQVKEQNLITAQTEWQKQYDEKIKKQNDRIEHQAALIDKVLKTNVMHLAITRDVILPIIYREHREEVVKKMYYNTINIQLLQEHQFEGIMISEYQKFYHEREVERFSS